MHERALVIGSAAGVWEEVEEAKKLYAFDQIIVINAVGVNYPDEVHHWVSFHIDLLPHWVALRKSAGLSPVTSFWSSMYHGGPLRLKTKLPIKRIPVEGGSSGLIAAMVSLEVAQYAVLAGVPMDPERAHFDKTNVPWTEALDHRKAWENYLPQLKGRVISMSGWTKWLLGSS